MLSRPHPEGDPEPPADHPEFCKHLVSPSCSCPSGPSNPSPPPGNREGEEEGRHPAVCRHLLDTCVWGRSDDDAAGDVALSDPPKGPSLDKRTHAGFWTWTRSHRVLLARGSPDMDGPILQRKLAQ